VVTPLCLHRPRLVARVRVAVFSDKATAWERSSLTPSPHLRKPRATGNGGPLQTCSPSRGHHHGMRTEAGIHFKRGGTGEPTLLLLHGLGTGEVWRGLEEQLAERARQLDRPGSAGTRTVRRKRALLVRQDDRRGPRLSRALARSWWRGARAGAVLGLVRGSGRGRLRTRHQGAVVARRARESRRSRGQTRSHLCDTRGSRATLAQGRRSARAVARGLACDRRRTDRHRRRLADGAASTNVGVGAPDMPGLLAAKPGGNRSGRQPGKKTRCAPPSTSTPAEPTPSFSPDSATMHTSRTGSTLAVVAAPARRLLTRSP
jgi:hypothetical protein